VSCFWTIDDLRAADSNLAREASLLYYRHKQEKLEACDEIIFLGLTNLSIEVRFMITNCTVNEGFEISPRFRRTVEERIARLERDAQHDEELLSVLKDADHIRRHMRLVFVQRAEALRMRIFLDRARTRLPRPLIAL
jgi:hypothetical protein